jgi:nicotinate-nucleotide adenylyltransferase
MKVGLLFGSFNPIHIGHILMARTCHESMGLDEVWFVMTPHNPFKQAADLAPDNHRIEMAMLSCTEMADGKFAVCDIEMNMPRPSYTYDTLSALKAKYPDNKFSIIVGSDNILTMKDWKNGHEIMKEDIIVVSRPGHHIINTDIPTIKIPDTARMVKCSQIELSSTELRQRIKDRKSIKFLVSEGVRKYIEDNNLYL